MRYFRIDYKKNSKTTPHKVLGKLWEFFKLVFTNYKDIYLDQGKGVGQFYNSQTKYPK